jgi:hypothetical protein
MPADGSCCSARLNAVSEPENDLVGGVFHRDPVIEAYKAGIDRTLLRQNLRRSVEERIRNLVELQRFAEEVRRAGREQARRR